MDIDTQGYTVKIDYNLLYDGEQYEIVYMNNTVYYYKKEYGRDTSGMRRGASVSREEVPDEALKEAYRKIL